MKTTFREIFSLVQSRVGNFINGAAGSYMENDKSHKTKSIIFIVYISKKKKNVVLRSGPSTSNPSLEANILQASMSCKLCTVYSRVIFVVRYTTFRNLTTKGIQSKPGTQFATRISLDKKLKDQNGALYTFSLFRFLHH